MGLQGSWEEPRRVTGLYSAPLSSALAHYVTWGQAPSPLGPLHSDLPAVCAECSGHCWEGSLVFTEHLL